MLADNLGWFSN
ncbi:hypothetical protein NXF25_017376 [Crotalus adamanteus]|uniref:Uncharacterized protein n=1 Tax=Crotalus adamanteus TaxID=8729 RepID=A0AAW1ATL8_CROAD